MAVIADFAGSSDGTPLTGSGAYVTATGAPLAQIAGTVGGSRIQAGRAHRDGAGERHVLAADVTPASADYDAQCTVYVASLGYSNSGPCVRIQPGGDRIALYYDRANGQVRLREFVGGVDSPSSDLGTVYSVPDWLAGETHTLRLSVAGTTVEWWVDGVKQSNGTCTLTAAGRPGLQFLGSAGATTGHHLDDFASTAFTGAAPNTAPTVLITRPAAGSITVPAGTELVLRATATDVEDADLTASILWSSSNPADAPGGGWPAGGTLVVDTSGWTPGVRTISAGVTDAGGLAAAPDTFSLTIGTGGSTLILEDDVQQEILQSGTAATVRVALRDAAGAVLAGNPLAPGDVRKSVDGGAAVVLAGDAGAAGWPVVNGFVEIPLAAGEVTGSEITLLVGDQDGSAFLDRAVKVMVVGYDPRAAPASTTQVAGAVGDMLHARLAS